MPKLNRCKTWRRIARMARKALPGWVASFGEKGADRLFGEHVRGAYAIHKRQCAACRARSKP